MSADPIHVRIRRRSGTMMMNGLFQGASTLGKAHPRARRALRGVQIIKNVPYLRTGMGEHLLDVYVPSGAGPFPIALYVHGGGFKILSKETHWSMALRYQHAGYLVFTINYRLAPAWPFPSAIEDACSAFEWVVKNAGRYGGDLDRLVLAGESAGGNLVTALAAASCYERPEGFARRVFETGHVPRAVVAACGILQVTDCDRFARRKRIAPFVVDRIVECEHAYLGRVDSATASDLDLANPLLLIERQKPDRPLPPFFAPVGTRDPLLDDSRRLAAAIRGHGGSAQAAYYQGEIHAFHAMAWRPNALKCWRDTFAFLDRAMLDAHAPEAHAALQDTALR